MAYIATKPVRFDKDYAIGEIIPDEVIDPSMTKKLVEMGRILKTDIMTAPKEAAPAKSAKQSNKTADKAADKTANKTPNKAELKEIEPAKAEDAEPEKKG